jgi:methylamine--corrinoid protein Co-methyltransferase
MLNYWDILLRCENGPLMKETDFDILVGAKARELARKYDIQFDRETIVPDDDDLADRVFEAAVDFTAEVGIYVSDTGRVIKLTRDEILSTIDRVRSKVTYGSGKDAADVVYRGIEDRLDPFIAFSPVGNPVPQEIFSEFIQHYARERITDGIFSPLLTSYNGIPVKSDTPMEIEGSIWNLKAMREAARLVGRPDIGFFNWASTAEKTDTIFALAREEFGARKTDGVLVAATAEMKVDYERLKKTGLCLQAGYIIQSLLGPLVGGYAGGPAESTIVNVAHHLLAAIVYRADIHCSFPIHIKYTCNTTPELLWLTALTSQALSRNSHMLLLPACMGQAGPCTEMNLLEFAAYGLVATVSGSDSLDLGAQTMNRHPERWTVMAPKLGAEVGHIAARMGMTRGEANEITKKITKKYQALHKNPPLGKKFSECFDLATLEPTPEFASLYEETQEYLEGLGLRFATLKP